MSDRDRNRLRTQPNPRLKKETEKKINIVLLGSQVTGSQWAYISITGINESEEWLRDRVSQIISKTFYRDICSPKDTK